MTQVVSDLTRDAGACEVGHTKESSLQVAGKAVGAVNNNKALINLYNLSKFRLEYTAAKI